MRTIVLVRGLLVFFCVGTATSALPPNVMVVSGGSGDPLQLYSFDSQSGATSYLSSSAVGQSGWIAAPFGGTSSSSMLPRVAYTIGGGGVNGTGLVKTLNINKNGVAVPYGTSASSGGSGPTHISVHPWAAAALVANYGSGHIAVLPILYDWSLGAPTTVLYAGANAHMIQPDASGKYWFVPCLGVDYIAQYVWTGAGQLVPNNPPTVSVTSRAGPRHLAFHPGGNYAFVVNELDSTIATFAYNPATGSLVPSPRYGSTLPPGRSNVGQSAAAVLVAPDGRFVYATNRGVPYCGVAVFVFDSASGALSPAAFYAENDAYIFWPRFAALTADGRFALVVGERSNAVAVFSRDAASGALARVAGFNLTGLRGPSWAAVFATSVTSSCVASALPSTALAIAVLLAASVLR